jgi:hypothetical protein
MSTGTGYWFYGVNVRQYLVTIERVFIRWNRLKLSELCSSLAPLFPAKDINKQRPF